MNFQQRHLWNTFVSGSLLVFSLAAVLPAPAADPRTNSWFTTYSGRYARIYTNAAMRTSGTSITTWSNGTQTQANPAYSGVQEVYSSASWVYLRTSGLGSHTMGPWLNGNFPNLPINTKVFYRIPRSPTVPGTKTVTGNGAIGYFVDGVAMFDSRDAFYWNGTADTQGSGYWNRDAYVNESATFDPAYAHQPGSGAYHYHASPIALRYLLGDHVDFNTSTKFYSESTNAVTAHSPLLGWVRDGYPVYGPYGYSSASNSASGVRRMISGYVQRNGQFGSQNLTNTGRTGLPLWAQRLYNVSSNVLAGPANFTTYPLGRYMEDNDYLGDLGKVQGVDFDLDEYNGRWCYTPEFPGGTYAYFVSISSNGTPTFPYNIGRAYYGNPTGNTVTTPGEAVVTNFMAGPNTPLALNPPGTNSTNYNVSLVWTSVEGGTYQVASSTDGANFTTAISAVASQGISSTTNYTGTSGSQFARVQRTALATYDPVGTTAPVSQSATQSFSINLGPGAGTNAIAAQSGTYGAAFSFTFDTSAFTGLTAPVSYTASGMPAGISFTSGTRTFSGTPTQVGSFTVAIVATDSGAPVTTLTNSFSLTINKAALTVAADNFSRAVGDANPTFTASYSGFVNSETLGTSGVTGSPSLTTTATSGSAAGSYAITCAVGTLASANYAFTLVNGTLTVTNVTAATNSSTARNILLIIADDYGIDSSSLYNTNAGASLPPTPNINALKNSGVLFRHAYGQPTCSPSRASMLTGRQPFRHGVTTAVTTSDGQLTAGEFTLPDAFAANSQLGYSVASFGKWHLTAGANNQSSPNNIGGWPHYAGSLGGAVASFTNWTKVVNGVTTSNVTTYATTDVVNDSAAWIQARGTNPWFAWVAFNAPHTPFHKPPGNLHSYNLAGLPINSNQRVHFEAAVEALDTEIGRLLQSVNLSNTTVIFIGDNGTMGSIIQPPYTTNRAKDSIYEGGVRVPLIIAGAGVTNQNRESAALVNSADVYSTILELAGINVAATQPATLTLDARSLLPILTNGADNVRFGYAEQSGSAVPANEAGKAARNAAGYRLIQFQDGHEEFYYVPADANEQTNLLASALSSEAQANYSALQLQLATYVNTPVITGGALETSWATYSGAKYARIYPTDADALAGASVSTWTPSGAVINGTQASPAYAGIESVRVSASWVFVKSGGLGHHVMGPWYSATDRTTLFVNWPSKQNTLARFPRVPAPATSPSNTALGAIGLWVDGTSIYNTLDGFVWNGTADASAAGGNGSWQRDAQFAESPTFDKSGGHQPGTGDYHHHISASGLRYLLGDHVDYNAATHTYSESAGAAQHSPILGWAFDGYPIYGPYGYSNANDTNSAVRRMVSGYVLRDGNYGTTNLAATGRTSYPAWALATGQPTTPNGPAVNATYPLGRYVQDYDHLADRGYTQGADFDLDRYNGRPCRTPEFPGGTYAYFVTIAADGTPAFPYIMGRQYYGVKAGEKFSATATNGFTSVESPNVTNFIGGASAPLALQPAGFTGTGGGQVTLKWDSVEGGRYVVESSDDLAAWQATGSSLTATNHTSQRALAAPVPARFYRIQLDAMEPYDAVNTP